jgi:hypothetical protein
MMTTVNNKGNKMTSIFIVRAENSGAPESIIYGVYPTAKLAEARMAVLEGEEFGYEIVFYDEVKVGPMGADCEFANR